MAHKAGDVYESPSGGSFTVTHVTKKTITVDVERVVRKNGKQITETRTREMPVERFELFARPYDRRQ